MTDGFTCTKCQKERPAYLHDAGKRRPRCKICEAHRKHVTKVKQPMVFAVFEADFLDKRALATQGMKRCSSCGEAKSMDQKWRGNMCWPCHLAYSREWKAENRKSRSRLAEYRKQNARRGCKTYGSREAMQEANGSVCVRNAAGQQISFIAGDPAIEACMSRLAKRNAIERLRHYIKDEASDEWVESFYAAKGKPWNNPRLSWAEKWRIRYRADDVFSAGERMRHQVRKATRRAGVGDLMRLAIKRGGRSRVVERQLGYSIAQLCGHLERQFTRGMSWERFRAGEIHIDHITPQAAFDLSDPEQWRACWCLSNLRPCWATDNRAKKDSMVFLL